MQERAISRDVALNVLSHLTSRGTGPFDRGDIVVALSDLEMPSHDANVSAVLAAQEVHSQMKHVEEGAAA